MVAPGVARINPCALLRPSRRKHGPRPFTGKLQIQIEALAHGDTETTAFEAAMAWPSTATKSRTAHPISIQKTVAEAPLITTATRPPFSTMMISGSDKGAVVGQVGVPIVVIQIHGHAPHRGHIHLHLNGPSRRRGGVASHGAHIVAAAAPPVISCR